MADPPPDLSGATLRLDGLRLPVTVGGATHPVPVGPLQASESYPSIPWDSGRSTWTELSLRLGPDGLWVERVEWEDIHLAGRWPGERRWFTSSDGVRWSPAPAPAAPGAELGRVTT